MGPGLSKVLRPVEGAPMVARVVDALVEGGVDEVVVVTGHQGAEVQAALTGRGCRCVLNPDFAAGMSTSVRAGIAALTAADGALVALGDMPWVTPADVAALVAAFARTGGIVAPAHGGRRGNPVLWPAHFFAALAELDGDAGAKALLEAHAAEVVRVPCGPGVLRDADTAADLTP